MFEREEVDRAVDLQRRTYLLLKWLAKAVDEGFIGPGATHQYTTIPESAAAWITTHLDNLPENARPAEGDTVAFSNLLATYLESSFDFTVDPGPQLGTWCGCFCPMCSYIGKAPHLTVKKVKAVHKKRARRMMADFLRALALDNDLDLDDDEAFRMAGFAGLREPLGLCAYMVDLRRRLKGDAVGPAALALWRTFAWTPQGAPKKGFRLTAQDILDAEQTLLTRLRSMNGVPAAG